MIKIDVPTCLTFVVVGVWVVSFIVRIKNPTWSGGQALDAGILMVLGYWFVAKSVHRNGTKS